MPGPSPSGWKTTDPSLFLLFRVYCHQYLKQEDVFSMKQLIYLALVIICGAALLVACALLYLKLCRSEERFMEL